MKYMNIILIIKNVELNIKMLKSMREKTFRLRTRGWIFSKPDKSSYVFKTSNTLVVPLVSV